ncbi:MAG: helix-turn-helix domain-containing protein [Kluyvera ascorbata]|nr:helix-turn-helix domain-containing protein [Kluyvera ascorbata]MDU3912053.1 helix-turn-helix domain-containing protein [Kluyvera ascorbata]
MNLMAKAMSIKVGNPLRKLVLIKLSDNANDKGECWPSYQHIADHCECSKTAVRNHIDALEMMGLLKRENRIGVANGKGNTSNVYYLNLDATPMPLKSTGLCNFVAPPMPPDGTPPMPPDGTRTSHSFEPVNEPLETVAGAPAGGVHPPSKYAFEGMVIKLNHDHFQKWLSLYQNIDLTYELKRLDIEFTADKPKNWFITASQKLNYQNKQSGQRAEKTGKQDLDFNNTDWAYGVIG